MTRAPSAPAVALDLPADDDREIDAAEAELASRLRLAVTRLHRRLRQQAGGGLSPTQTSALASTDRLGSPTLGELAAHESVQPPSMTRIVAGLEEMGLVGRVVDPADRRVARIEVSEAGRQVLVETRSRKNVYLARQLHQLTPDEREALGGLTALLERLAEGLEP
ncbi:MAG TPA: MarR family transcriptional regulator [Acidimicrobiales bacterium]|jgi:DNA-binding MarR family transcriptional regulator|nr:MarR family transcriptional regulator [Acidimicrobiales bacterium]